MGPVPAANSYRAVPASGGRVASVAQGRRRSGVPGDVGVACRRCVDEWAEFAADCGSFEEEIAKEIRKRKFTFAELEEEEQGLERLRRWYRDLKRRDVLELPEVKGAEARLRACVAVLDGYAERVYRAVHSTSADGASGPPGTAPPDAPLEQDCDE